MQKAGGGSERKPWLCPQSGRRQVQVQQGSNGVSGQGWGRRQPHLLPEPLPDRLQTPRTCAATWAAARPAFPQGHTCTLDIPKETKKGLSVERGNRSFKNDTGLLSCYILLQLLLGEVSEWRKIRIILTEINAFMENREP